jgi:hypothetical protein
MAAPVYTITFTPNGSKKAWFPRKTPQNDGFVFANIKIKTFSSNSDFSGI